MCSFDISKWPAVLPFFIFLPLLKDSSDIKRCGDIIKPIIKSELKQGTKAVVR